MKCNTSAVWPPDVPPPDSTPSHMRCDTSGYDHIRSLMNSLAVLRDVTEPNCLLIKARCFKIAFLCDALDPQPDSEEGDRDLTACFRAYRAPPELIDYLVGFAADRLDCSHLVCIHALALLLSKRLR